MAGIGLSSIPLTPLSFVTSSATTDSHGIVHPTEAVTVTTLHDMLARVLEQTYALWQAQASANYTLHEIRQTIPALQENAKIHERLRRVEAVTETLAHGQHTYLRPLAQPSQGTSPISNRHSPREHETTHHVDSVLHASGDKYPSGPSILIHSSEDIQEEASRTIPLSGGIDQLTADLAIPPGKIRPPEPQHDNRLILASTIKEDENQSLDVSSRHISMSHAHAPSEPINLAPEDALYVRKEQSGAENDPLILPTRDESSTVRSNQSTAQGSTPKHASDPQEVVSSERQSFGAEHEHGSALTVYEDKIASLEGELVHPWFQVDSRQLSSAVESVPRVVDEALHNQLADHTNLTRRVLAICGEKKALLEEQWTERLRWKEESSRQMRELTSMASWLIDDRAATQQREEEHRLAKEGKPGLEHVLEELHKQNAEHRELLNTLSESWRADNSRQHEETINAIRTTANEQIPYNVQGYLDEFSKCLSVEVHMLLGEVGKLREERRRIQYEIGYLMSIQSTLGPVGAFDGPPEYSSPQAWPSPAGIPLPESPQPRSGWRALPFRRRRRVPRPEAPPAPERRAISWTTWQPNPAWGPTPPPIELGRGSPGLFGPRSPADSYRVLPGEIEGPGPSNWPRADSWVTWQPNPAFAPTPPSTEPTLLVPDRGSPGLFGPRSPRDSYHG